MLAVSAAKINIRKVNFSYLKYGKNIPIKQCTMESRYSIIVPATGLYSSRTIRPSTAGETVPDAAMRSINWPAVSPPDLASIRTSAERKTP